VSPAGTRIVNLRRLGRNTPWIATTVAVLFCLVWAWAAFRPGQISPELTRSINDFAWLVFLFPYPPFSLWLVAIAVSILRDNSQTPTFPRWAAYYSLWTAALFAPAGFIIFFKTGPLAFNGFLAFYVALGVFLVWLLVMTALAVKAIDQEEHQMDMGNAALRSVDDSAEATSGVRGADCRFA
jgi:hypothetical protein